MDGYDNNGIDSVGYNNTPDTQEFGGVSSADIPNAPGYNDTSYIDTSGYTGYDNSPYTNSPDAQGYNNGYDISGYNNPAENTADVSVDQNFAAGTESTLNSLNSEPTPAEIEDMKRERAARRRKRMLREKRRRERRRQAIIRCSLLLAAVILVIVIIVKIFAGIGSLIKNSKHSKRTSEEITTEATTTEEPVAQIDEAIIAKDLPATREEAIELLNEQAETDSDIKNIVENEAVYPDILLKHLAINSELIDFALFYPAQINIPFDGDFTIDTDTGEVPLFLEYDSQWGYADYGSTILGLNGAAPACLSMAYVYLTGDGSKNPIIIGDFSMEKGYLDDNDNTDFKLMTDGAEELGLESNELDLDKENLIAALEEGNAIICAVLPGDFTRENSFIIIKDYRNGLFYVNDPTSQARSQVGWDFKRLSSQISTMWALKQGSASISTGDGTDDGSSVEGTGDGTVTDETGDGGTDGTVTDDGDGGNTDDGAAGE